MKKKVGFDMENDINYETTKRKMPADITGMRFGKLVVLCRADSTGCENDKNISNSAWKCKCDCGKEIVVTRRALQHGTESCGCAAFDRMVSRNVGKRFGRLVIIEYAYTKRYGKGSSKTYWRCKCDCGNEKIASLSSMQCGYVNSCGCLAKEFHDKKAKDQTTHGGHKDRLYWVWHSMKSRCGKDYGKSHYHKNGIAVCDEWANDYAAFREWALANGYDPNADKYQCTIDRIDNNGNYNPENCRWVNATVQASNTSQNHFIEYNGKRMTVTQWAEQIGIKPVTLFARIHRGWPVEKVLSPYKYNGGKHDRNIEERKKKV